MDCGYQTMCWHFVFVLLLPSLEYQHFFVSALATPAVITSHGIQGRGFGEPAHPHTPLVSAVFKASEGRDRRKMKANLLASSVT